MVESTAVGLWRSWERASMAWKRSSVRSRSGPPNKPHVINYLQHHPAAPKKAVGAEAFLIPFGRSISTSLELASRFCEDTARV